MRDLADSSTVDLFQPVKRRRGRPASGQAKSRADIQREYRQRLKAGLVQQLASFTSDLGNVTETTGSLNIQINQAHKEIAELYVRIKELQEQLRFTEISYLGERNKLLREQAENEKLRLEIVKLSKKRNVTKKG